MSTFVDNDGLRIEVLFSGNGVRAVSSQWATQGRVLHNGSLSLFGIVGERRPEGAITWSNGATWQPLAATPPGPFSPSDAPARSPRGCRRHGIRTSARRRPRIRLLVRARPVVAHVGARRARQGLRGPQGGGALLLRPDRRADEVRSPRVPGGGARGEDAERVAVAARPDLPAARLRMRVLDDVDGRVVAHPRAPYGPNAFEIRLAPWWGNESAERARRHGANVFVEQLLDRAPVLLAVGTPSRPTHACGTCDDRQARRRRGAVEEFDWRCRPHVKDQLGHRAGLRRSHAARPPRGGRRRRSPEAGVPRPRVWQPVRNKTLERGAAATPSSAAPTGRRRPAPGDARAGAGQ